MFKKLKVDSARFLTWKSIKWVIRHRAYTPWYLIRYWRFFYIKFRYPQIVFKGIVFFGKKVEIVCDKQLGYLEFGASVHVGNRSAIRCHEGVIKIGDKVVFGQQVLVDAYLNIEIGAKTLLADHCFIYDYDHNTANPYQAIKDQGISKAPVLIGENCWLAAKSTILKNTKLNAGVVIGANAVASGEIPAYSTAVGIPAKVIKNRHQEWEANSLVRKRLAENLAKIQEKKQR